MKKKNFDFGIPSIPQNLLMKCPQFRIFPYFAFRPNRKVLTQVPTQESRAWGSHQGWTQITSFPEIPVIPPKSPAIPLNST